MKYVFISDFTTEVKCFAVENEKQYQFDNAPYLAITSDATIEDIIDALGTTKPNEIIFKGQSPLFRELEVYYRAENKEIIILWQ